MSIEFHMDICYDYIIKTKHNKRRLKHATNNTNKPISTLYRSSYNSQKRARGMVWNYGRHTCKVFTKENMFP